MSSSNLAVSPLSEPLATPGSLFGRSYARSRLWLGISGVGLSVLAALLLLARPSLASSLAITISGWLGVPASASSPRAVMGTAAFAVLAHAVLLLPVDLLGGLVVVRTAQRVGRWLLGWARGLVVVTLLAAAAAGALLAGHRVGGAPGVVAAAVLTQLLWFVLQGVLARAVGGVRSAPMSTTLQFAATRAELPLAAVREIEGDDVAFVGGWVGVPAQLWVPARWVRDMPPVALTAELVRRRLVRESGLRTRGVLGAIVWNTIGVAWFALGAGLAPVVPSDVLLFMSGMTLWSFVGVLVLPTPSRRAIFATDRDAARTIGSDDVVAALRFIDAQQDDEATRARGVETIFHPVPSRSSREEALVRANPRAPRGAYHLTRMMLGMSGVTLGLLGRAVHCNVGRPGLWVVYPGD